MRNSWVRMVRWLVVTLAVLTIVAQPLLAGIAREPVAKPGACCNKCKCCVSGNPGGTPRPVAPAPTRTTVAKGYQLVPVVHAPLLLAPVLGALVPLKPSSSHFSPTVPVFIRHCTFLI